MRRYIVILLLITGWFTSCEYFQSRPEEAPVVRVNDHYLYWSDLKNLISENTTPEDSTQIIENYINRWATRHLLIDQALINLDNSELERYEKLVQEYRSDLLTEAYKNSVVNKQLDSIVSDHEYQEYYDINMANYRLNEVLLKVRYVHLSPGFAGVSKIKKQLERFDEEDKQALSDQRYQFISSNFNDSMWIQQESLKKVLPILKQESNVLKKSNFAQVEDSLGVYLIKTEDVVGLNEIAPLSYIKPTIKQVIINKRKLRLINKFERDITKDAIENNKFQIYTRE